MKHALPLLLLLSNAALADDAAILKCRTLPDAGSRLACYDAMPVGAAPAATPAAVPVAAPVAGDTPEQRFGLSPAAQKKNVEADTIQSTVVGEIGGWSRGTRIRLANGQVWNVVDGNAVLPTLANPKAEIARGVLGAFYLRLVGYNDWARVKRVE